MADLGQGKEGMGYLPPMPGTMLESGESSQHELHFCS